MTEPVAYLVNGVAFNDINRAKFYSDVLKYHKKIKIDVESIVPIPLYTAEQLHPRVKMTQAEFDEWKELDFENNIFGFLSQLLDDITEPEYPHLTKIIYGTNGDGIEDNNKQLELANLFMNYDQENPEETIEIVPDMKWFVRSKKADNSSGHYCFRSGVKHFGDYYYAKDKSDNKKAYPFDTQEEAEKWTNPLTEAVQLPVEGE